MCGEENLFDARFCGICGRYLLSGKVLAPDIQPVEVNPSQQLEFRSLGNELKTLREEIAHLKRVEQEVSSIEDTVRGTLRDYFEDTIRGTLRDYFEAREWAPGFQGNAPPETVSFDPNHNAAKRASSSKRPRLKDAVSRVAVSD